VGADCKLYHQENAAHWKALPFITRIPHPLRVVSQVMTPARAIDRWHEVEAQRRYQCLELCHFGIAQRWLVVHSEAAAWRAEASVHKAQPRAYAAIAQPLFPLQARRFDTPAAAQAAVAPVAKTWTEPQVDASELSAPKRYATTGRPRADTPCQAMEWQRQARVRPDAQRMGHATQLGRAMCWEPT
jgi:hypothetical protein